MRPIEISGSHDDAIACCKRACINCPKSLTRLRSCRRRGPCNVGPTGGSALKREESCGAQTPPVQRQPIPRLTRRPRRTRWFAAAACLVIVAAQDCCLASDWVYGKVRSVEDYGAYDSG